MPQFPIHQSHPKRVILSVGGSLIIPEKIDTGYLKTFKDFVHKYIGEGWQFILITGGGAPARWYSEAANTVLDGNLPNEDKDWLGIHATRLNAHLVRTIFRDVAQPAIITNPEEDPVDESYKVIVTSGWKPGWSTDYVACKMAQRFSAKLVINLSNITQVYTADPKKDPTAKPIEHMSWTDFRALVGDEWIPSMNTPFDPIGAKLCHENGISVLVMNGANIENLEKAMRGEQFVGTLLSEQ